MFLIILGLIGNFLGYIIMFYRKITVKYNRESKEVYEQMGTRE